MKRNQVVELIHTTCTIYNENGLVIFVEAVFFPSMW